MSEVVGTSERIQEYLDRYCIGGYSSGTIGTANRRYLLANYPEFVRVYRVYRLGEALEFVVPELGRGLSRKFGQFLADLSGLDDYALIDDDVYQQVMDECEEAEVAEVERICREHNIDESVAWNVLNEGDYYFEDTDGMADIYGMSMADVEGFVDEVRKQSQGWATHYEGKGAHYAKWCEFCADTSLPSSELEVV